MATVARPPQDRPRRKKEARTDIWSNLLKQTAQAQARSRTQAIQHRELIVCGGSPDDQRELLTSLARPPPAQAPSRNQDRRPQRSKGELRLSNRYAYGYGHVTLYSPPPQSGTGVQVLGAEAEEVARVEVHTLPDAEAEYVGTLRALLKRIEAAGREVDGDGLLEKPGEGEADNDDEEERRRPGVCILLSWKKPWEFLHQIQRWVQILAKSLLPDGALVIDPMDVIKDAELAVTIVVQHTETQEDLFRESYKEEDFDWISQCLRTAIMPLHPFSSLVYTSSAAPPQQPGHALTEPQKVIYHSLGLDLAILSPKIPRPADSTSKKEDLAPKQEFMDRMAIIIPPGWDSYAYIRILSETFSPEDLLRDWLLDLQPPPESVTSPITEIEVPEKPTQSGAEVYESAAPEVDDLPEEHAQHLPSAIKTYESRIIDPQSHRRQHQASTAAVEVTTKPDQQFLAEMRAHLQELEASDSTRERPSGVSTTSLSSGRSSTGLPPGQTTGALGELGEVSFNVGGVSYDSVSAEMAIERLRRPQHGRDRETPPKPPGLRTRGEQNAGGSSGTHAGAGAEGGNVKSPELPPIDKLEEYFASLVAKSGGSRETTPSRTKE
ncbi:uncharacterized protein RCC_11190 [Ramularia collo-cygni]|uniref:Dynein light intermediate chain 2 n=1 Tax=Ramularia collo-cygni TaxID=112498 RepID=A0A2D3VSC1_9PEZI|nr:uncharacterized protein RCC_11190 [Ramularia collo-cygni]CZT25458.1 uncharacterized protein RCC_11190 [Ramularia collo-cygni]